MLLVITALSIVTRMAWGLDRRDSVVAWTTEDQKLTLQIPAPTGCLDANEMGDKP